MVMAPTAHGMENLRKYAGIVVDAKTGQVMYEAAADERRYPASVTKVMTLYIAFQELEAGNLTLDSQITVSRHAASAVPTKLGLRAGAKIRLEDAMKSLVTLSANDMARAIAEHISGSEEKFAERMTATARALGMSHTTYGNASGLPDARQVTTVRDQSILALAVYQHFPNRYSLFQTKSFNYGGRTYGNHNRVLGYMDAVDGIKTGYINAAGSNLMTAARKDNRHIIVIAFGFNSSASRDQKVRELVREYFDEGLRGSYQETAMIPRPGEGGEPNRLFAQSRPFYVSPAPLPGFRLAQLARGEGRAEQPQIVTASLGGGPGTALEAAAGLAGAEDPKSGLSEVMGAWINEGYSLGTASIADPVPVTPPTPAERVQADAEPEIVPDQIRTASISPSATAPTPASEGRWTIQVGAAVSADEARTLLQTAQSTASALSDRRADVDSIEQFGRTVFRARFVGFGDREQAQSVCSELRGAPELGCLVIGG
ncbi:penicillin-binding protein [Devosia pacifica]|uniref:Penicillin-binding protein n=1 Tax=Devosia pacifica TaxID=1335967 RepID=A0A918S028_9HYPH|nr:D-alanyl-D-alanine carboxypeptidase [Devosia pacifica]GHA18098.1 penicillin-binding protein [Devosia pacifica]